MGAAEVDKKTEESKLNRKTFWFGIVSGVLVALPNLFTAENLAFRRSGVGTIITSNYKPEISPDQMIQYILIAGVLLASFFIFGFLVARGYMAGGKKKNWQVFLLTFVLTWFIASGIIRVGTTFFVYKSYNSLCGTAYGPGLCFP